MLQHPGEAALHRQQTPSLILHHNNNRQAYYKLATSELRVN